MESYGYGRIAVYEASRSTFSTHERKSIACAEKLAVMYVIEAEGKAA